MVKSMLIIVFLLVICFTVNSCSSDNSVSPKDAGFDNQEEYLENPSVNNGINESGIAIYLGDDPPVLSGEYTTDAEITDASSELSSLEGAIISSNITLYNQTSSGHIAFIETVGNITVFGSGGYITGENNTFTVWQESEQSGEEAGLPDDITINVALLISGYKDSSGHLHIHGISIISRVDTDNDDYDVEGITGLWWMYEGEFYLQGPALLHIQRSYNGSDGNSISSILREIFNIVITN